MGWILVLMKGFRGHPSHPPLTDVTVGALTVATVAAVVGWFDVAAELVVPTAFVALVIGLVAAVPTALTGLLDLLDIRPGTPARATALIHLFVMLTAVALYVLAAVLLHPGLEADEVPDAAAGVAVAAFVTLTFGGWVGGSLAYVYGIRVVEDEDAPTAEALRPRLPG